MSSEVVNIKPEDELPKGHVCSYAVAKQALVDAADARCLVFDSELEFGEAKKGRGTIRFVLRAIQKGKLTFDEKGWATYTTQMDETPRTFTWGKMNTQHLNEMMKMDSTQMVGLAELNAAATNQSRHTFMHLDNADQNVCIGLAAFLMG